MGIYIQKIVGGFFASAKPPEVEGDWRTPDAYSREEITSNLLRLGVTQDAIDNAFDAAEKKWHSAHD